MKIAKTKGKNYKYQKICNRIPRCTAAEKSIPQCITIKMINEYIGQGQSKNTKVYIQLKQEHTLHENVQNYSIYCDKAANCETLKNLV